MIGDATFGDFVISADKSRINVEYVQQFLSQDSYWAKGIPVEVIRQCIANSIAVGVYHKGSQIGFARLITDHATFGYLADVFIDERFRGKGLSKKLMEFIMDIPETKTFRRMVLATRDAHGLYSQFGFSAVKNPSAWMEIHRPDIYLADNNAAL